MDIKKMGISVIAGTMLFNTAVPTMVKAQSVILDEGAQIEDQTGTYEERLLAVSDRIDTVQTLENINTDTNAMDLYKSILNLGSDYSLLEGVNLYSSNVISTIEANIASAIETEKTAIVNELVALGFEEEDVKELDSSELKELVEVKLEELEIEKEEVKSNGSLFEDYIGNLENAESKLEALANLSASYNNIKDVLVSIETLDDVLALDVLVTDIEAIIESTQMLGLNEEDLLNIAQIIALDELGFENMEELTAALEVLAENVQGELEVAYEELIEALEDLDIQGKLEEANAYLEEINFETLYEDVKSVIEGLGEITSLEDILALDFEEIFEEIKDLILEAVIVTPITTFEVIEIDGQNVITGIVRNANTVDEVLTSENFPKTNYTYKVENVNGLELTGTDLVGTGTVITVLNGEEIIATYVVSLSGDISGDGVLGFSDIVSMINYNYNGLELSPLKYHAGCFGFDAIGFASIVPAITEYANN